MAHLDDLQEPWIGNDADGNRFEIRDWLWHWCFGGDHELYDDIQCIPGTVKLGGARRALTDESKGK